MCAEQSRFSSLPLYRWGRIFARRKREGKYWYRPPGGESRPDVALRVHSFLGTLTRDYREKSVLVVCHMSLCLCFVGYWSDGGEKEYMKIDSENDVLNCSVTRYLYERERNKLVLAFYNKTFYRKH